jgi:hypothetical protein
LNDPPGEVDDSELDRAQKLAAKTNRSNDKRTSARKHMTTGAGTSLVRRRAAGLAAGAQGGLKHGP